MRILSNNLMKLCSLASVLVGCSTEPVMQVGTYNPKTFISTAVATCHTKDYSSGMAQLERIMTNEKANPLYWNALGICYSLSGQNTKANFYFNLGLESIALYKGHDKKHAEAAILNNIGFIHLKYKRFNDAFTAFKKAEFIAPDLFIVQLNISQILLEFNYDVRALSILNKLEANRPGDQEVLYSLALIYSRKSEYEKALLNLSKLTSAQITRPDISGVFAYNLLKTNQLSEAKQVLDNTKGRDNFGDYVKRNKALEEEILLRIKEQSNKKK